MTQRLTPEQEEIIRDDVDNCEPVYLPDSRMLLAEIDAVRAELAGAEERGRQAEREACANWLTLGDPADEKLGAAVRRGDHVLWWESTGRK